MHPLIIAGAIALSIYYLLDGEEKPNEKENRNSGAGGPGGEPGTDGNQSDRQGGLTLKDVESVINTQIGELKDVFQTQFDAFRNRPGDGGGGQQNGSTPVGETEGVDQEPAKKKTAKKKKDDEK